MPSLIFPDDAPKAEQRRRARAARARAALAAGDRAGHAIARHFLAGVPLRPGEAVAGYWPIGDEADPVPLMLRLFARGHRLALPCVDQPDVPLVFRAWKPGDPMRRGPMGIPEPQHRAPVLTPALVLVPGLCFDRAGGRLGYGGGFYDRTLHLLRHGGHGGRVHAVGISFSAQVTGHLPRDAHDEPLDRIVTEKGTIRCTTGL